MAKSRPSKKEPPKKIPLWIVVALIILLGIVVLSILPRTKEATSPASKMSPEISQPGVTGPLETEQMGGGEGSEGEKGSEKGKNHPPVVTEAKFEYAANTLTVTAGGTDPDDDPVTFTYDWKINDNPAGSGNTVRGFKRGDHVQVTITPFDGKDYGLPKVLTREITNVSPTITEQKELSFDGNNLSYQIKATDADGDQLTYALEGAPQGMSIDNSGLIRWTIPEGVTGLQRVKVKISDGHGGTVTADFEVNAGEAAPK